MRAILLFLATMAAAFSAPLTGNKITADGTYTVAVTAGQRYVFSAAGTFGGGSLAVKWNDGTTATAFANSPATTAETWTFTAPSKQVDLVLSGSTDASITVGVTLSSGLDTDFSSEGGANKITKTDSVGNLYLAPLRGSGDTGGFVSNGGNLVLTDRQGISWMASDGTGDTTNAGSVLARFRYDRSHPNEFNIDSAGNICLYWGLYTSNNALQLGSADGGNHFIYLHSGYASAGNTTRQSVPVAFNTMTWTGGTSTLNRMAMQAAPLDTTGTNSAFQFFRNATLGSAQAVNGTKIAEIADAGVWSAGTAPVFESLTDAATITQTCSKYRTVQAGKVTITDNRALAISGAEAGMRGVIYVSQDAIGSRTLSLPSGSATASGWALSTAALAVDRLQWEYDGTYFYWTIDKGITLPSDTDATAFISTTGATDTTAINTFVVGLKSMGLWATSVCWPMRSTQNYGAGTTLKSLGGLGTFDGTLTNGPTWGTDGITFDGTNDYVAISNPSQSTALAAFSMFSVFDSDQSASKCVFGAFNSSTTQIGPSIWAGGTPLSGSDTTRLLGYCSLDGTNTNESHGSVTNGNTGAFQTAFFAANSSEMLVYANTTSGSVSGVRATYWNNETAWAMGRRGNASAYFTGPQAFHFFSTTKLTAAQHTALRDLYKATLGAGLSLP